jgi:hypothetical protein
MFDGGMIGAITGLTVSALLVVGATRLPGNAALKLTIGRGVGFPISSMMLGGLLSAVGTGM